MKLLGLLSEFLTGFFCEFANSENPKSNEMVKY